MYLRVVNIVNRLHISCRIKVTEECALAQLDCTCILSATTFVSFPVRENPSSMSTLLIRPVSCNM